MLTPQQAKQRAQAGAQYLDTKRPGWPREANKTTLDIGSKCGCLLWQLFGDYDTAARDLPVKPEELGFEVSPHFGSLFSDYHTQTQAWIDLIDERVA